MKAIVQDRFGSPDVLSWAEVDDPAPGPGEVLVRVEAASINARDWHLMRGDPYLARLLGAGEIGVRRPRIPIRGTDFAGIVEAVSPDVSGIEPGDEVYGEAPGAFAEYVTAPVRVVARKPAELTFEQAAALPLAANTALMGLRDVGKVSAGERVLINGASGGVGTFAVQLAVATFGAEVTAVCSPRNADLVRQLGAHHIVDYTTTDVARGGQTYDVVFDLVGNRSLRDLRRVLAPAGTLLVSGGGVFTGGSVVGPMGLVIRAMITGRFVRAQTITTLDATPSRDNLALLGQLAAAGTITPRIDRTFPLSDAAAAIRYVETEHARAKVVLTV
jgi:NADPH:quinone reductase-like Zn-dependent oxidoreductase